MSEGGIIAASTKQIFAESIVHVTLICELLFSYCSPKTILRVGRTCRGAHSAVLAYIAHAYNLNRLLYRFFEDPLEFRELQARTSTLISGSTALQFFDRAFYPSSDLDLYAHKRHRREIGHWLLKQGYKFAPNHHQAHNFEDAVFNLKTRDYAFEKQIFGTVFSFLKPGKNNQDELKVQIIVASTTPMQCILNFHSTCVMNIISFEKAYCLFPRATLEEHRSILASCSPSRPYSNQLRICMRKYEARGWTFSEYTDVYQHDPAFHLGERWISDNMSWVIPLDKTNITLPPPPNPYSSPLQHDPVAVCNWHVSRPMRPSRVMEIDTDVLESPFLRHAYVINNTDLRHYLEGILSARTSVEERKRAANLEDIEYFDAEFSKLCRDFLRIKASQLQMVYS